MQKVSVIIPCFQEEKFLASCLDSLIMGDFDFVKCDSEIIIVDGMSTDNTISIINLYCKKYSFIKYLINKNKYAPFALNMGIKESKGEIVIRIDAHCQYPSNYITELTTYLVKTGAGNVGGCWNTLPGNDSDKAKAISVVMTSPLGMGAGTYRTVLGNSFIEVDTVPFGCWKKEIFAEVGNFDPNFLRDQDYEHNVRIRASGKKILLLPWVRINYFARENFSKLWSMFFQYGYWRPFLNKKHKKITNFRQLVPALWVLALLLPILFMPFFKVFIFLWLFYILLWLFPVLYIAAKNAFKYSKGISFFIMIIFAFFITHFSYGWGYLNGIYKVFIVKKSLINNQSTKSTR